MVIGRLQVISHNILGPQGPLYYAGVKGFWIWKDLKSGTVQILVILTYKYTFTSFRFVNVINPVIVCNNYTESLLSLINVTYSWIFI